LESTRFHLFRQSPSLEKDWLLPKNNKIDLFQVGGEAQCLPSEGWGKRWGYLFLKAHRIKVVFYLLINSKLRIKMKNDSSGGYLKKDL